MPRARSLKANARRSNRFCRPNDPNAVLIATGRAVKVVLRVGVFALVASLGGCSDDAQFAEFGDDAVILAFGDSLTYGTGAKTHQSYPAVLEELTGVTVINAGVPGEESDAGAKRLSKVVASEEPDLVILCHGGNDFLRKRPRAKTEKNLRSMINYLRERDIAVVMLGVPDFGLLLSTADVYETVADDLGVPLEDDIIADLIGQNKYKSDHVHPNADGYRMMAKAVQELLVETGALASGE